MDNGFGIFDNSHVSIEKAKNIFLDDLMDVQEGFNAIGGKVGKMTTEEWWFFYSAVINEFHTVYDIIFWRGELKIVFTRLWC